MLGFVAAAVLSLAAGPFAPGPASPDVCMPRTCQDVGATCGPVYDGCGTVLACGDCSGGQTCGGGGTPNVCASPPACTGLCLQQTTCPGGGTTTVSGKVYMPNGTQPLPNVLVYVPTSNVPPSYGVQPFPAGTGCQNCATPPSGAPLVSTISNAAGDFVLRNVPVGTNIPVVFQIGRWRRIATVPSVAACSNTAMTASTTRLPASRSQGDIPLTAIVTGADDAHECLLRKIGVSDAEFGNPGGANRVQFFTGRGAAGAVFNGSTPNDSQLFGAAANPLVYDAVLYDCQGTAYQPNATNLGNFGTFVGAGGRVLVDHLGYPWLHPNGNLDSLTSWNTGQAFGGADPQTATVNTAFPKGEQLAAWLGNVGVAGASGTVIVSSINRDFDGVTAPAVNWLSSSAPVTPLQFSFNTPVGTAPEQQCGRITYLDHHPERTNASGTTFPAECAPTAISDAELLEAYQLFDLGNCIQSDAGVLALGVYAGDDQRVLPGNAFPVQLSAQVVATDGSRLGGIPVSFTVTAGGTGTTASFVGTSSGLPTGYDGVVTAPTLTVGGASPVGDFTVTASAGSGAPAVFTLHVGTLPDAVFKDGFE